MCPSDACTEWQFNFQSIQSYAITFERMQIAQNCDVFVILIYYYELIVKHIMEIEIQKSQIEYQKTQYHKLKNQISLIE